MGSRMAVLIALMLWCLRTPGTGGQALLAGYGVGVAFLLPLEFRVAPLR
jgi:hypothetical protein